MIRSIRRSIEKTSLLNDLLCTSSLSIKLNFIEFTGNCTNSCTDHTCRTPCNSFFYIQHHYAYSLSNQHSLQMKHRMSTHRKTQIPRKKSSETQIFNRAPFSATAQAYSYDLAKNLNKAQFKEGTMSREHNFQEATLSGGHNFHERTIFMRVQFSSGYFFKRLQFFN